MFLLGSENQTYTVEEAVEKLGFGPFQLIVTVFSGLLWVCVYVFSKNCNTIFAAVYSLSPYFATLL